MMKPKLYYICEKTSSDHALRLIRNIFTQFDWVTLDDPQMARSFIAAKPPDVVITDHAGLELIPSLKEKNVAVIIRHVDTKDIPEWVGDPKVLIAGETSFDNYRNLVDEALKRVGKPPASQIRTA